MKIYFVRHGHPNYEKDCLTELGKLQAAAAAERLAECGISEIYASTCGRAMETAGFLAEKLGLEVVPLEFMREIAWGAKDGGEVLFDGHPWMIADHLANQGEDLLREDWREREPFVRSLTPQSFQTVSEGIDAWLEGLGYRREGNYYRTVGETTAKTVALFSHGGSSSVVLSHLFGLAFPYVCATLHPDFTSVTVVEFSDEVGRLAPPRALLVNDARHIQGIEEENSFGR